MFSQELNRLYDPFPDRLEKTSETPRLALLWRAYFFHGPSELVGMNSAKKKEMEQLTSGRHLQQGLKLLCLRLWDEGGLSVGDPPP